MSYVTLATERFDDVVEFYGVQLGFPVVDKWDRPNARGRRFELGGMRLEILDNQRERRPLDLGVTADRFHVVVEVPDIEQARQRIQIDVPPSQTTSWGARLIQIRDPDGVPVTFLQWMEKEDLARETLYGRITTGLGRGKHFTQLDWARRQFMEKLGFDPFPGTLNLILDDAKSLSVWQRLQNTPGVRVDNPNGGPRVCDARCFRVSIEGQVDAAIVLPEVEGYAKYQVEVIAPIELRDALTIKDGDWLVLEIK